MKKGITYLFLVFTFHSFSAENTFERADFLYQLSEYETAIDQYHLILEKGLESSSVYYNLGVCYFQLEKYEKSKNAFNRCLVLDSENKKCKENIKLCKLKILKKDPPEFFYITWWKNYTNLIKIENWYLLSIFSILILLILTFLSTVKKKLISKYLFVILLITNTLFYLTIQKKQAKNKRIFKQNPINISINK